MPVEVELKFSADGAQPLEHLAILDRLGPAQLGPAERVDEQDRYLDTADGRFAAQRWACRLRTRGERTIVSLKGPAEDDLGANAALHRRPELEGPARPTREVDEWPPSPARDFVDELRRGQPLVERLALLQQRTERDVRVDGATIGTLSLDRVEVRRDDIPAGSACVVELELRPESHEDSLAALEAALRAIDGLTPDPSTKLERALAILGDDVRRT